MLSERYNPSSFEEAQKQLNEFSAQPSQQNTTIRPHSDNCAAQKNWKKKRQAKVVATGCAHRPALTFAVLPNSRIAHPRAFLVSPACLMNPSHARSTRLTLLALIRAAHQAQRRQMVRDILDTRTPFTVDPLARVVRTRKNTAPIKAEERLPGGDLKVAKENHCCLAPNVEPKAVTVAPVSQMTSVMLEAVFVDRKHKRVHRQNDSQVPSDRSGPGRRSIPTSTSVSPASLQHNIFPRWEPSLGNL